MEGRKRWMKMEKMDKEGDKGKKEKFSNITKNQTFVGS